MSKLGRDPRRIASHKEPVSGLAAPRSPPRQRRLRATVLQTIARLPVGQRPTIAAIAAELSMTVRTLQRRLAPGGLPFRAMLNECRKTQAIEEIREGDRTIGEISARLGYTDPAHFVRAFRRWTGRSPTDFAGRTRRAVLARTR